MKRLSLGMESDFLGIEPDFLGMEPDFLGMESDFPVPNQEIWFQSKDLNAKKRSRQIEITLFGLDTDFLE